MDSLEINKAAAAVFDGGNRLHGRWHRRARALVHPTRLQKSAIKIDVPTRQRRAACARGDGLDPPVALELVSADPALGESLVKAQGCVACHSFNEGGKAGIGPNLYGVVGAPHGHMPGTSIPPR